MYLNILDPNQTVKFITPLYNNSELARTGVLSDGSCLMHAILHATSAKYRNSDNDKRRAIVKDLRNTIGNSLTKDQWLSLSGGELARISFAMEYRNIFGRELEKGDDILNFFKTVVSPQEFEKIFESNLNHKDIYFCSVKIIDEVLKVFDEKTKDIRQKYSQKIGIIQSHMKEMLDDIFQKSINNAFDNYVNVIKDVSQWLGEEHMELLSTIFEHNLYFFDGNTKLPYSFGKHIPKTFNKNLVFIWIDQTHFELLGKVQDVKISRILNNNDDFIVKINQQINNN